MTRTRIAPLRRPTPRLARHRYSLRTFVAGLGLVACATGPSPSPVVTPVVDTTPSSAPAPQEPATPASSANAAVPVSDADPQWGPVSAPVTIVMFTDLQCPFCARAMVTIGALRETYGDRLRVVFKHLPLDFHRQARPAADAASTVFALGGIDAFLAFQARALTNGHSLTEENFERWAAEAGISPGRFHAAYAAKTYTAKVDEDIALASKLGIVGTPTFRINGVPIDGAQPMEEFRRVVDQQLEEARRAIESGVAPLDVYATLTNRNHQAQREARAADDSDTRAAERADADEGIWKIPVAPDDPVRGPKDALVTLVLFSDYQCPFCKRVEATLEELRRIYGNDIRIVWKDNPLDFHPRARPAAAFARYVYRTRGEQAFWRAHDALFESAPALEEKDLENVAKKLGVSWNAAKRAMESAPITDRVQQDIDLARDFRANSAPHFFINGVRFTGAQPLEKFQATIDRELARAKELLAANGSAPNAARRNVYEALVADGKSPPPPERKEVPPPDSTSPFRGSANGKIVLQVFSDYECPFCKRIEATLRELEKKFGKDLKIVHRHLPLSIHRNAALAAEAAQEAFEQQGNAGFWRYHDRLFEAQDQPGGLGRDNLERIAQEVGLDLARFRAALDARRHHAKVVTDLEIASRAGISGTPSVVINGYFVSGAHPAPVFDRLIRRALDDAKRGPTP